MADSLSSKQLMSEGIGDRTDHKLMSSMDDIVVLENEGACCLQVSNTSSEPDIKSSKYGHSSQTVHDFDDGVYLDIGLDGVNKSKNSVHCPGEKYPKRKKKRYSCLCEQINGGVPLLTYSSIWSESVSIKDDDDADNNIGLDKDTVCHENEDGLKNVQQVNKINPKSTSFCWRCSSYASSLSQASGQETDNICYLPYDFETAYDFYPDSDWEHSSGSSVSQENMDNWDDDLAYYDDRYDNMLETASMELTPFYPHSPLLELDCSVCLTMTYLRPRVCCGFQICQDCMTTYVAMKVNEAKVQIECPSDGCSKLVHRDEINERLSVELKEKFAKFLIDANMDPCQKTCPACSKAHTIKPEVLLQKKKRLKFGLKVTCEQCSLVWCFLCQAPYHIDITCKQYRKGNKMVKKWAKERSYGQSNAQKCPKCGIYIQKIHGCDHMKCMVCETDFCYQCGDRYISNKLLGDHWSRFSPLGCKYKLLPKRPGLRRFIRGTNFAARIFAGIILAGLGLAAGAVLVGASVVIVPGYGLFMLKQHLWRKKQVRKFEKRKKAMLERVQLNRLRQAANSNQPVASDFLTDKETAPKEDLKQVHVMVHRSLSFSPEETKDLSRDIIINKYTSDSGGVTITRDIGHDKEDVVVLSDVTEVENCKGYPTVVCNVVSKVGHSATEKDSARAGVLGEKLETNFSKGLRSRTSQSSIKHSIEDVLAKSDSAHTHDPTSLSDSIQSQDHSYDEVPLDSDDYYSALCDFRDRLNAFVSDYNHKKAHEGKIVDLKKVNEIKIMDHKKVSENKTIDSNNKIANESKTMDTVPKISEKDRISIKGETNGCFGNIFSKKVQDSPNSLENLSFKSPAINVSKYIIQKKADMYEKAQNFEIPPLRKLSSSDNRWELRSAIIHESDSDFRMHDEFMESSISLKPTTGGDYMEPSVVDIAGLQLSSPLLSTKPAMPLSLDMSKDMPAAVGDGYVSQHTVVTHL